MADVRGAVGAFAFGGVGWLVTSFVGAPFRKFYDLRSETIYKSVVYDNVTALERESADGSIDILERSDMEIERLNNCLISLQIERRFSASSSLSFRLSSIVTPDLAISNVETSSLTGPGV